MAEQKNLPLLEKELPQPHDMLLSPGSKDSGVPKAPMTEGKSHLKWLIVAFVLAAVAIFLFWSTVLNSPQTQPTPIPTPTIAASLSPTSDPTAGWKTYTNSKNSYQLQYPQNAILKEIGTDYIALTFPSQAEYFSIQFLDLSSKIPVEDQKKFDIQTYRPWGAPYIGKAEVAGKEALLFSTTSAELTIRASNLQGKPFTEYEIFMESQLKRIHVKYFGDGEIKKLFDQILATFKFTDQEKAACTQEAKLCPDGSSVGRTGPNCEFSPCPN